MPFTGELFVYKSVVNTVLSESTPDKDKGYKLSVEKYYSYCVVLSRKEWLEQIDKTAWFNFVFTS